MKRHLISLLLAATMLSASASIWAISVHQAHITTPGFYLGVQGGVSFVGYTTNVSPGFTANSVSTAGGAARVYGGFDITRYFGTEIGVTFFYHPHFIDINGSTSAKIKNNIIFLVAKGLYPFNNRLAAYASLGVGYVARSGIIVNNVHALSDQEIIRPVYGLGIAYLLWTRWSADLTWLQAAKRNRDHLPFSNFVGLGIRYKFAS